MALYYRAHPEQADWTFVERLNYMRHEGLRVIRENFGQYLVIHAKDLLRRCWGAARAKTIQSAGPGPASSGSGSRRSTVQRSDRLCLPIADDQFWIVRVQRGAVAGLDWLFDSRGLGRLLARYVSGAGFDVGLRGGVFYRFVGRTDRPAALFGIPSCRSFAYLPPKEHGVFPPAVRNRPGSRRSRPRSYAGQ